MKTFKKVLFEKVYKADSQYTNQVKTKIDFVLYFDFKEGLRFRVGAGNVSNCSRNPFKAFVRTLEHESIGMMKYDKLKERYRETSTDFSRNK